MIENFFFNLSQRLRGENDLSDVTWAMTQTSDNFFTEFLRFFFPTEEFGEIDFIREYVQGGCRPDFYFEHEGNVFLIECKIWDGHHHFEQYIKEFGIPPERLGYITNYPYEKKDFKVRTWSELYQFLQKRVPPEECQLWKGYLEYLKEVCNIYIPTRPMNIDGMYSLYEFYNCLDYVFSHDTDIFSSRPYENNDKQETNFGGNRTYGKPNNGLMGKYFQIDFKGEIIQETSWGWMGVFFHREHPEICIGFSTEEGWGLPVYNYLKPKLNTLSEGKLYTEPYEEDDAIWFDFKPTDEFDKMTEPKSQVELLRAFFIEVMESIA